jgi:hypothetical protein
MAYTPKSSNPGTSDVYGVGNVQNNDKLRIRYIQYWNNDNITDSVSYENSNIACFMKYLGDMYVTDTAHRERNSGCTLYLKGILVSLADATFHYNTLIKNLMGGLHEYGVYQASPSYFDLCTHGLILVPKDTAITNADAISSTEQAAGGVRYIYVQNVKCNAIKTIDCNGQSAKLQSTDTTIPDTYEYVSGTTNVTYYDNLEVTILAAELKDTWTYNSHGYIDGFTVTRANILIRDTVTGKKWNVELTDGTAEDDIVENYFLACHYHSNQEYCDAYANSGGDVSVEYTVPKQTTDLDPTAISTRVSKDCVFTLSHILNVKSEAGDTQTIAWDDVQLYSVKTLLGQSDGQLAVAEADAVLATRHAITPIDSTIDYYYYPEDIPTADRDAIYAQLEQENQPHNEHMVVAVNEEHVTYVNFDNTGSYPRGFLKKLFYEQQIPTEQPINYTDQALEENILMSDTLIIPLSDDYITPMEFYEGTNDAVEVEFSSKLVAKTAADKTDIPTYFWVESLKNWCYYDMTTVNDACNIAMLKVWNGKDNWLFLDNLLESAKLRYIPRDEYAKLRAEYQNIDTIDDRKAEIKEILSDFADHTLSQLLVYPCNLDKLKTISIDRIYHGAKANYAGKPKDKDFLDYLYDATIGNVVSLATGTWYIISSPFSTHKFDKFKKGFGTIATGLLNAVVGKLMVALFLTPEIISKFVYYGLDKFINSFSNISSFWRIDHYQTLFASCRYVILPYDNKYSNNDEVTFQTIRNHNRWDNVEGGIMSRESIIAYLSINTTIGSPFIARSSTGELMLATAFTYSGPVREKYDSSTDLLKKPGIIADDIKLSNELLQKTLGNGYDKTIKDWLNFMGNTPDESLTPTVNVNNATAISKSVVELANTNQTAEASMLLTANRSKVSSDVENVVINTLKKW